MRALIPPVGLGPLAGVMHLLGGGGAAIGGAGAKLAVTGCCAALLAGGAATTYVVASRSGKVEGSEHVQRERATGTEGGGRALIGKPIRAGTKLPANVAIATVLVRPGTPAIAQDHAAPASQLPGGHGVLRLATRR